MANVVCTSFKSELIKGDHDFANDTFIMFTSKSLGTIESVVNCDVN